MVNSRAKGARAEREVVHILKDAGFEARRGQQFSGSPDSPDVVWNGGFHLEVKHCNRLRMQEWIAQAQGDCGEQPWAVVYRSNGEQWKVVIELDEFLKLVKAALT